MSGDAATGFVPSQNYNRRWRQLGKLGSLLEPLVADGVVVPGNDLGLARGRARRTVAALKG